MNKILVILSTTLLLSGCCFLADDSRTYSERAAADIVTVIKVSPLSAADNNDNNDDVEHVKQVHVPQIYQYTIKDHYGRQFEIFDLADQADFNIGECVIRWWDRWDQTYPRLSKADEKCSLIENEPISNKAAVDQQFTPKLMRIALLNSWLDYTETALIKAWGEPDKLEQLGDSRFLEYRYKRTTSGTSGRMSYTSVLKCTTRWEIKNGYIRSYIETGNACY